MKIEGHRPYFDTGPGVSPMGPQQSQPQSGQRIPDAVARVAKASGSASPHSRQAGEAATLTELKQKADKEAKSTDVTGAEAPRDPLDEAQARNALSYREPTLPRLSAEALATALMTAEPDKAMVPRVLPADMAAQDE